MSKEKKIMSLSLETSSILFGVVITLIFGIVLIVVARERTIEFYDSHREISVNSTKNISYAVERILQHKHQLVQSFAEDNIELIENVAANPQNFELYTALNKKLGRYFTDYFASNITKASGELIIDDFEGNLGELCLMDTKYFIENRQHPIQIHPNPKIYHYDILIELSSDPDRKIFIVTFSTEEIKNLLLASTPANHNLMLVHVDKDVIEITKQGSREKIPNRLDYRLTEDERKRTLSSTPVAGTLWNVVDMHEANLFSQYRDRLIKQGITIYLFFIILSTTMSLSLFFGVRRKQKLEHSLVEKNRKINALNIELEKLSLTDGLTAIPNRRYLETRGPEVLSTARRFKVPLMVALIDIDYFKQYNDTYGHQAGDACLVKIATILEKFFRRANEFTARYGGEEFIAITMSESSDNFVTYLEKLLDAVRTANIEHEKSKLADHVTISVGVAMSSMSDKETLYDIIKRADTALYQAKAQGRNQIVVSNTDET